MALLLALFTSVALASPPSEALHSAYTGSYVPAETDEELDARWDAEVDRVADTLPWIIRGLVRSKLKGERPPCPALHVVLSEVALTVQCDGEDQLEHRFDGSGDPPTNRDGDPVDVVFAVNDSDLQLDLSSPRGSIATRYAIDGDLLTVDTVTRSARVDEPFNWLQTYRRR